MINYKSLLIDRNKSILYQTIEVKTDNILGWIGGNPPKYFDDILVSEEGVSYTFYLTIQNPFDAEKLISIFIPAEYDYYSKYNIYPNCSIKVFEHKKTSESESLNFRSSFMMNKRYIVESKICDTDDAINDFYLVKFGGMPDLIQDKEHYYKALSDNNFEFLFQIDESGYPDDLIIGNAPFNFGSLYIYAEITDSKFINPIAGFWQFS
jgi:hypothetical protein